MAGVTLAARKIGEGQGMAPAIRREFATDLRNNGKTGRSLKAQFQKVSRFYSEIALPEAARRQQHGGPVPGETREDYLEAMFMEAVLAAKLRIFGHILEKKWGIKPE